MKNKKGFTLTELMVVIVILVVITLIAVPVYNKINKSIQEKNYKNKIKLIEDNAIKYAEDTHYETFFVQDLIENGYIDADENNLIFNDLEQDETKRIINCNVIRIIQENGIYYADFLENDNYGEYNKVTNKVTCNRMKANDLNKVVSIKMYKESINDKNLIKYDKESKWWVNKNVVLKAEFNGIKASDILEIKWYKGMPEQLEQTNVESITINTNNVLQQNYSLYLKTKDQKEYKTTVKVYIDKLSPKFYDNDKNNINKNWVSEITYNIKSYDNESGVYGYRLENLNNDCSINKNDYQKNNNFDIKQNGIYKICLMDNVGNVYGENREINKIDNIAPKCGNWFGENYNWSKDNQNIGFTCIDNESGCKVNQYQKMYNNGTITTDDVTFEIEDNAGNKTKCSKNVSVYLDKDSPSCVSSGGINNWTKDDVTLTGTCTDSGSGCIGNVTNVISNEGEHNNLSPGIVYDKVGNMRECPKDQNVKIDKTAPTIPRVDLYAWINNDSENPTTSTGLTLYSSNNWTSKNIFTQASGSTDTLSGLDRYEFTVTGVATNCIDKKGSYRNIKTSGTSYIKYRACDKVGNCSNYTDDSILKIDKVKPVCGTSTNITTWTNDNRTININCSDELSGCSKERFSKKFTEETTNGKITIKDNVGNEKECGVNVFIDKTKPTITCTSLKTNGLSNSICSQENLSYYITCTSTDELSGIKSRKVSWGGPDEINGERNAESDGYGGRAQLLDTLCQRSSSGKYSITVKDRAGNTTTKTGTY